MHTVAQQVAKLGLHARLLPAEAPHLCAVSLNDSCGGLDYFVYPVGNDSCSNDQIHCDINSPWKCHLIMFGKLNEHLISMNEAFN